MLDSDDECTPPDICDYETNQTHTDIVSSKKKQRRRINESTVNQKEVKSFSQFHDDSLGQFKNFKHEWDESEIIIEEYEVRDQETPGKKMARHIERSKVVRGAAGVGRIPSPKAILPKVEPETAKSDRAREYVERPVP